MTLDFNSSVVHVAYEYGGAVCACSSQFSAPYEVIHQTISIAVATCSSLTTTTSSSEEPCYCMGSGSVLNVTALSVRDCRQYEALINLDAQVTMARGKAWLFRQ